MPHPDAEIDAAARRVFAKLPHPTRNGICPGKSCRHADEFHRHDQPWWKPGQMCDYHYETPAEGEVSEMHQPHELPPPDWRDWSVFGRLLMETKTILVPMDDGSWCARCLADERTKGPHYQEADDPRAALILALNAMLEVE